MATASPVGNCWPGSLGEHLAAQVSWPWGPTLDLADIVHRDDVGVRQAAQTHQKRARQSASSHRGVQTWRRRGRCRGRAPGTRWPRAAPAARDLFGDRLGASARRWRRPRREARVVGRLARRQACRATWVAGRGLLFADVVDGIAASGA
jgi:hypothetical protein